MKNFSLFCSLFLCSNALASDQRLPIQKTVQYKPVSSAHETKKKLKMLKFLRSLINQLDVMDKEIQKIEDQLSLAPRCCKNRHHQYKSLKDSHTK